MKNKKDRRERDFFMYTQEKISGLTAIDHMVKGKLVYSAAGTMRRIQNNRLEFSYDGVTWEESRMLMSEFLNPNYDWYAEPEFDVRKELFDRPGKWVAKYYVESEHDYYYLGFDTSEMASVYSRCLEPTVSMWNINADPAGAEMLDNAIPLSEEDLEVLATFKNK